MQDDKLGITRFGTNAAGSLEAICQSGRGCIIEASLEIARDAFPRLDVSETLLAIEGLAAPFAKIVKGVASPLILLERLNEYFFGELGFSGNVENYYDPRNSYLHEVVRRRRGIPITLSILYQALALKGGLALQGINFPSHFLLVHRGPTTTYIDVFHQGRLLQWLDLQRTFQEVMISAGITRESDLADISPRDTLLRMLRNLKGIHARGELESCLRVQERIVQLLPESTTEKRDLGVLLLMNHRPLRAIEILKSLLAELTEPADRQSIEGYLQKARAELVLMN